SERLEVAVDVERHVVVRDHRVDAGQPLRLARVQLADPGRVEGRAERLRPEHPRHAHVVDERGAARDVRDAVVAGEAGADRLHAVLPTGSAGVAATSPRTAASTASRILT